MDTSWPYNYALASIELTLSGILFKPNLITFLL